MNKDKKINVKKLCRETTTERHQQEDHVTLARTFERSTDQSQFCKNFAGYMLAVQFRNK